MMATDPVPNVEQLLASTLANAKPPSAVTMRIVAGAMAHTERRPVRWYWLVPASVCAMALVVGTWLRQQESAPTSAPQVVALTAAAVLAPGWQALGAHAVELSASGRAEKTPGPERTTRLRLHRGQLACRVAKLGQGESFHVETPHADVKVVGTRFVVELEGSCTWVRVSEGTVWVTSPAGDRTLTMGEAEKFCTPPPTPTVDANAGGEWVREALALIGRNENTHHAAQLLARYLSTYPGGVFEEEALFYLCIVKQQAGDREAALALAERFWVTFPDGRRARELKRLLDLEHTPEESR